MVERKDAVFSTAIYSHEWVMCIETNSKSVWFTHVYKKKTHRKQCTQRREETHTHTHTQCHQAKRKKKHCPKNHDEEKNAGQNYTRKNISAAFSWKQPNFRLPILCVLVYLTLKRAAKTRVYEFLLFGKKSKEHMCSFNENSSRNVKKKANWLHTLCLCSFLKGTVISFGPI